MRRKTGRLRGFAIQEVHGSRREIDRILQLMAREWVWHFSPGRLRNEAGLLFMVRKKILPDRSSLRVEEVIRGQSHDA